MNLLLPGVEEDGERIIREFGIDIYTMEYSSAVKKNEIMPFAITCMDTEMIITK